MTRADMEKAWASEMRRRIREYEKLFKPRKARICWQMIGEYGELEATIRLVNAPTIQDGLADLIMINRSDLTFEDGTLDPRFSELFSDATKANARRKLGRHRRSA
jgi:hypothetical protein